MKKVQSSLLGFFKKVSSHEDTELATQSLQATSAIDETSIIPDTPEQQHLSAKPTVLPVPPKLDVRTSTPSRKRSSRRRSSLVARRQAELDQKYADQLSATGSIESSPISSATRATLSAKLRRGNYDTLNYAPIDQVNRKSVESTVLTSVSKRSQLMVARATASLNPENVDKPLKRFRSDFDDSIVLKDLASHKLEPHIPNDSAPKPLVNSTKHNSSSSSRNEDHDVSFGQLDISDWTSFTLHESENLPSLDSLLSSTKTFLRGVVSDISTQNNEFVLQINLMSTGVHSTMKQNTVVEVQLSDSWTETEICVGDTVHIVPGSGFGLRDGRILIADGGDPGSSIDAARIPAALIVHPDILISGTKLVGSFYCERRSVLEQFWCGYENEDVSGDALDDVAEPPGRIMLMGSVVHELFQKLILVDNPTLKQGEDILEAILGRPDVSLQLYSCNYDASKARADLHDIIASVIRWIQLNRTSNFATLKHEKPVIQKVVDVEENIWSTRFGIKGKIDLSAIVFIPNSAGGQSSLIPLELKTGRPSFSTEHKGQVLLYLLMMLDRYGPDYAHDSKSFIPTALSGWLIYLSQSNASSSNPSTLVSPNMSNFRGLLQTRNRLAVQLHRFLSSCLPSDRVLSAVPILPSPIKNLRTCRGCPLQLACSVLHSNEPHVKPANSQESSCANVSELLLFKRAHLTDKDIEFFMRWSNLLLMENGASESTEAIIGRIINGAATTSTSGSIRRLKVIAHSNLSRALEPDQWETVLRPLQSEEPQSNAGTSMFVPGDLVIVSSDDGKHVGYTLATVKTIADSAAALQRGDIVLITSRPLPEWMSEFRLDRYASSKISQINLSNLLGLMRPSPLCAHLRSIINGDTSPSFCSSLPKQTITRIRPLLKHLNACQRTAVLRVLMANHYVLIKGYPGTGKTETLSSLLRVFIKIGKKILVVSHTHSAVDNLLARLVHYGETRILRLGSPDRVRSELKEFTLEHQLAALSSFTTSVNYINIAVESAAVIGCTAIAASGGTLRHPALSRVRFDLVLVDEASQLLMPSSLGSILLLRWSEDPSQCGRFVLVGDPHQLPPLVRNSRARQGGLDRSLFTHLLGLTEHQNTPTPHVVQLDLQYRMNAPIVRLANRLFYDGSLKPANSAVAEGTLADEFQGSVDEFCTQRGLPSWFSRCLSESLVDSVLFLDTSKLQCCTSQNERVYSNEVEAKLVSVLVRCALSRGLNPASVGVMAPHRSQVVLIKNLLRETRTLWGPSNDASAVEVNTVDQFQGRDKRMIVLSLTVCSGNSTEQLANLESPSAPSRAALLDDDARLTVAITRAKHKFLIVGCSCTSPVEQPSKRPLARLHKVMRETNDVLLVGSDDFELLARMA